MARRSLAEALASWDQRRGLGLRGLIAGANREELEDALWGGQPFPSQLQLSVVLREAVIGSKRWDLWGALRRRLPDERHDWPANCLYDDDLESALRLYDEGEQDREHWWAQLAHTRQPDASAWYQPRHEERERRRRAFATLLTRPLVFVFAGRDGDGALRLRVLRFLG